MIQNKQKSIMENRDIKIRHSLQKQLQSQGSLHELDFFSEQLEETEPCLKRWAKNIIFSLVALCLIIVILDFLIHLMMISLAHQKCLNQDAPTCASSSSISSAKIEGLQSSISQNLKDSEQFRPIKYISEIFVKDQEGMCANRHQKLLQITDLYSSNEKYLEIQKYQPFDELPFCLVVSDTPQLEMKKLTTFIKFLKYTNYKVIQYSTLKQNQQNKAQKQNQLNYQVLKNLIKKECSENSIVLMINQLVVPQALNILNDLYQRNKIWMTYGFQKERIQIYSFYSRVFQLIEVNDFTGVNMKQLEMQNNEGLMGLAILQLSQRFKKRIDRLEIFKGIQQNSSISIPLNLCVNRNRIPYQQLYSMSQDYPAELDNLALSWKKFNQNRQKHYNGYVPPENTNITQYKAKIAIQNQQMLYLPQNHVLTKRQIARYQQSYPMDIISHEIPLCITVPSRNNVENNRYKKAMLSILSQNYTNYHIVFIDDNSDDGTLQKTKQVLENEGFPRQRVTYVKNLQRKFATYNIVHAAYSYCGENEIQMILDGDDRYIGKQVFKFFNALYQSSTDLWVAYSTYISSFYTYGESSPILDNQLNDPVTGGRKIGHYIGLERSWYVKLMRKIPLKYHLHLNGEWLDVMADDAFQYSFYQLAGAQRIKYFPEINYYYSMAYNNNQIKKLRKAHRDQTHLEAISMERNQRLDILKGQSEPNQQIVRIFQADKGIKFEDFV